MISWLERVFPWRGFEKTEGADPAAEIQQMYGLPPDSSTADPDPEGNGDEGDAPAAASLEDAAAVAPWASSKATDQSLRELFTASSAGDLHREALIAQVRKVKARDLAEGLQALVKSIGADTGPARHG